MLRNFLIALAAALVVTVVFAFEANAQVVPAQNQVITAPYGQGYVVSTSTSPTHKLGTALIDLAGSFITGILGVSHGGTGSSTLSGILIGNGTSAVQTLTIGSNLSLVGTTLSATGFESPLTFTYPLVRTLNAISLAFGTTTSNTWANTQTFTNSPVFSTLTAGTVNSTSGGTIYSTATSSVSSGVGISFGGTAGSLIGGSSLTITNSSPLSGLLTSFPLSFANPTLSWVGLATSSNISAGQALYATGANTLAGVATTSVTCAGTVSCTSFNVFGPSPITITGSGGTGTGLATTTPLSDSNVLTYSSAGAGAAYGTATTSLSISGPFNIPSAIGVLRNGTVTYWGLATTSQPSSSNILVSNGAAGVYGVGTTTASCSTGVSCTGFNILGSSPISITNSGVLSLAQSFGSAQTGALTLATSTTAINNDWGITNSGGTFTFNIPTATASIRGLLSSTDWSTFNNKLGAAITSIGPTGQTSTGPSITLATSTNTTNGLTSALTIVGSGATMTFTPSVSGTLAYGGGGTGTTTAPAGQLLYGGATAYQSVATSTATCTSASGISCSTHTVVGSVAPTFALSGIPNSSLSNSTIALTDANSTLTIGGSPAALGGTLTATLNLAHANTWSALQQFANASTSIASFYGPTYFGRTATTTIDSTGNIVVPSGSNLTITGKSDGCATFATGVLNSTGSACGSGGGGTDKFSTTTSSTWTNAIYVNGGNNTMVGIGTSTPSAAMLTISTSTASQIRLTDASLTSDAWNIRSVGNRLYFSTSSPLTFATSSPMTALSISPSNFGARLGVNTTADPRATLDLYEQNGTGCSPGILLGGNAGGDSDAAICRISDNGSDNDDTLQLGFSDGAASQTLTPMLTIGLSTGNVGIGSTTPWALLSVASSTWGGAAADYKRPLFYVGTSSDSFGQGLSVFATTTTSYSSNTLGTLADSGFRVAIGTLLNVSGGLRTLFNQLDVNGRIGSTWSNLTCNSLNLAVTYTANVDNICGFATFSEVSNATMAPSSLGDGDTYGVTLTYASASTPDGATLQVGPSIIDTSLGTTTPVLEAKVGALTNTSSTTSVLIGWWSSTSPTGNGCGLVASSTNTWIATCRNLGTASQQFDTGIATSTPQAKFRLEINGTKMVVYGKTSYTAPLTKLGEITSGMSNSASTLRPYIGVARTSNGTAIAATFRVWGFRYWYQDRWAWND